MKTISLVTSFLSFMIRLQAKATKKPYEVKNDFENFLQKLVSFFRKIIENSLSSFSYIDWKIFNKQYMVSHPSYSGRMEYILVI